MKNSLNKTLLSAISFIFMMLASQFSMAESNPFAMTGSASMQLASGDHGDHNSEKKAKCGATHMKEQGGKCGNSMKKKEKSSKCGDGMKKTGMKKDGKCGAGKCGANMKKTEKKKTKCGAGKCGGK